MAKHAEQSREELGALLYVEYMNAFIDHLSWQVADPPWCAGDTGPHLQFCANCYGGLPSSGEY